MSSSLSPPSAIPFLSAAFKLQQSVSHLQSAEKIIEQHVNLPGAAKLVVEYDEDRGTSFLSSVPNAHLPITVALHIGDAIHNINCALDHIASELGAVFGGDISRIHFPFHEDEKQLKNEIKKPVYSCIPTDIMEYITDVAKPYKDGDFVLWSIRKLDNIDKHRLIPSFLGISSIHGVEFVNENGGGMTGGVTLTGHAGRITRFIEVPGKIVSARCESVTYLLLADEPKIYAAPVPVIKLCNWSGLAVQKIIEDLTTLLYGDKEFPKLVDTPVFQIAPIGR